MALSSKRVRRLEKEAILRTKEFEHKCEQSSHLLTNSFKDEEDDENDRHRRYTMMRQTRQMQREIEHQVGVMDKINERRQQELQKKQKPPPMTGTTRSYLSSLASSSSSASTSTSKSTSSSVTDRANRTGSGATEKYTSSKHSSGTKFN